MKQVDQLINEGVRLKRNGEYKKAIEKYIEAVQQNPFDPMIHVALGKVAYLAGNQFLSIGSYLSSMHLQLNTLERQGFPSHLSAMYNTLTDEQKAFLPKKSGFIIFIDSNNPRHIAHAFADFNSDIKNQQPKILTFSKVYQSHIKGDNSFTSTLNNLNLTESEYMAFEENFYTPLGKDLLFKLIKWNELDSMDIFNLYLN